MLLTKRPENILPMWEETTDDAKVPDGSTWYYRQNVWIGASCSDQSTFDIAWRELAKCTDLSPVRFFSLEPLLGPIDMHEALYVGEEGGHEYVGSRRNFFQLAITGGESGPKRRPCEVAWMQSIADQCEAAGVAIFTKQDSHLDPGMQGRIPDSLWNLKQMPAVVS